MNETAINTKNATAEMTPSRRRFIASALAAALGISLADVISPGELIAAPTGCSTPGEAFVPVGEIVSKNNKLAATMTVKSVEKTIATIADAGYQCRTMKVRYYEGVDLNNSSVKWPVKPTAPGPGPTLRLKVGDQVHVRLVNAINPALFGSTSGTNMTCNVETSFNPPPAPPTKLYPLTDTAPSCFHGDNVTNLHYHGTHVTPDGHGDNVMIDVYPVGHVPPPTPPSTPNYSEFTNEFTIPLPPPASNATDFTQPYKMGQAPGTHWYHAHKHGSVALQLLNGMAGAIIIEGEFDDQLNAIPSLHGLQSTEKVLVIQQLGDNIGIQTDPQTGQPTAPLNTCTGGNPLPLVNGQVQPTIEMKPGEIQRWRFVNATETQVSHLTYRFIGQDVYAAYKGGPQGGPFPTNVGYAPAIRQIAYDGVQLAPENYNKPAFGLSQEFTIAAGNRIDILVQAPATAGKAVLAFRMLHVPPAGCKVPALLDPFLLNVNVTGSAITPPMSFPTVAQFPPMPLWLQWNESDPRNKIVEERILKFNNDPTGRPAIDAKAFDNLPDTTQYLMLNTAEQWTLQNEWASSIHPFHIHVNPFQVMEIFDPNNPPATQHTVFAQPYIWRDTIAIPQANDNNGAGPTTNGWVKIRSRYCDFPGTFVLHCHILDHEDRGMMETVVIRDPKMKTEPASAMSMHH